MQVGFGSGSLFANLTNYVDGTVPGASTIARVGLLQDWSFDISWEVKEGYGSYDFPAVIARGKAKTPIKLKMLELNANVFEAMLFGVNGQLATGEDLIADQESHTPVAAIAVGGVTGAITSGATALTLSGTISGLAIGMAISIAGAGPAAAALVTTLASGSGTAWVTSDKAGSTATTGAITTFPTVSISPPSSGTFVTDWGVQYSASGLTLAKQATGGATFATGNYINLAGNSVYNFAVADVALVMLISYEYTITAGYSMQVSRQLLGNLPTFTLYAKVLFQGVQLTLKFGKVVSTKLSLATKLDDYLMPEIDASAFTDTAGNLFKISMAEL